MPVPTSNQGAESKRWLVPLLANCGARRLWERSPELSVERAAPELAQVAESQRSAVERCLPSGGPQLAGVVALVDDDPSLVVQLDRAAIRIRRLGVGLDPLDECSADALQPLPLMLG